MSKYQKMKFEDINILELLPQRPPFVVIDKLLYCDTEVTRTAFQVKEENLFCDNGRFSEPGLIENIAQTCAVRLGYIDVYTHKKAVKLGFIGAIRNLEIYRLPRVDELLITQIVTKEEVFRMTMVNATIMVGEEMIVSCEMKISTADIDG